MRIAVAVLAVLIASTAFAQFNIKPDPRAAQLDALINNPDPKYIEMQHMTKCVEARGRWDVPVNEHVKRCISLEEDAERNACGFKRGEWVLDAAGKPTCSITEQTICRGSVECKACLAKGGKWRAIGMARTLTCITDYPDANKPCTRNTDCMSKRCLASKNGGAYGKCHKDNDRFGCFSFFNPADGGTICVD